MVREGNRHFCESAVGNKIQASRFICRTSSTFKKICCPASRYCKAPPRKLLESLPFLAPCSFIAGPSPRLPSILPCLSHVGSFLLINAHNPRETYDPRRNVREINFDQAADPSSARIPTLSGPPLPAKRRSRSSNRSALTRTPFSLRYTSLLHDSSNRETQISRENEGRAREMGRKYLEKTTNNVPEDRSWCVGVSVRTRTNRRPSSSRFSTRGNERREDCTDETRVEDGDARRCRFIPLTRRRGGVLSSAHWRASEGHLNSALPPSRKTQPALLFPSLASSLPRRVPPCSHAGNETTKNTRIYWKVEQFRENFSEGWKEKGSRRVGGAARNACTGSGVDKSRK